MKVLVTGGAGFIGANLCRRLTESGEHEVVVIDDLSTGSRANLDGLDVELFEGSFLDAALLDDAVRGVQAVVHLGAVPSVPRSIADPVTSHLANATGTVMVLEAARAEGDTHVIVASSSSVYGANPTLPKREDLATFPLSPYGASKLATEAYALSYQYSFGLPVLAFRFFNVFGPLQGAGHAYAAVVPQFVSAALDGRPVTVHGDGEQSRDFTSVGTVCDVITDAVQRRVTHPEPVNLAFGTRTSLLELLTRLEAILGVPIAREHVESRAGDVRHSQAYSGRVRELFPEVTPVDLDDALRATVEWFQADPLAATGSGASAGTG
ncbi:MAG TPA: NAD-dependent epimerase/dehydratase family protein [Acidimicrobiia bacterium]|nr:NAD-dependent epimerase/dehydratase family protein [Acidimicrobiia bacterium]